MKRQIILIMTDTTRKNMLGCYGSPSMITPNLDRLATEGIHYENAYACQPVYGPARSAIFTGISPHTNGEVTSYVATGDNIKTVGQRLTDNGIHCGCIGKWHLNGDDYFGNGVYSESWDEAYWYSMHRYPEELTEEERLKSRKSSTPYEEDMTKAFTYTHHRSLRALDFLESYRDEDYFLAVSYDEPHGPSLCPVPYNTMYEGFRFEDNPSYKGDLSRKPLVQQLWTGESLHRTREELDRPSSKLTLFLGYSSFVDYEIGRVLDRIRGTAPDAMVIFTSDHGDMLGNHQLTAKNAAYYKEIANIPLIIRGGEAGKVVNYPASYIGLVPTIIGCMGFPIPDMLEGKSVLPQIHNADIRINDMIYTEFTRYEVDHDGFGGLQMVWAAITERYKLTLHLLDNDKFYDMETNPYEICNRIDEEKYSEIRNSLHNSILEQVNRTRDLYRGYQWICRDWCRDKVPSQANGGCTRQRENGEYEPRQLDYGTGLPMTEAVRRKVSRNPKIQETETHEHKPLRNQTPGFPGAEF